MLKRVAKFRLLVGVVCYLHYAVNGQSWRLFSPPRAFTVDLPDRPKVVTRKQYSLPPIFSQSRVAYSYSVDLIPGDEPELLFGEIVLSKRVSNRRFDRTVDSNMLWIGGDDKHFSKQADLSVEGLHGREFFFDKGNMSGRALFINGGNRVYFLLYFEEGKTDSADPVSRIFSSFRPLRPRVLRKGKLMAKSISITDPEQKYI